MNNSVIKTIPQILKDNICTVFNLLNLFAIEERQPIWRCRVFAQKRGKPKGLPRRGAGDGT